MTITPSSLHQAGFYPSNVRLISNGDPCNQTFLNNPMLDLQFRTDVLLNEINNFETATAGNFNDIINFDDNHTHNGLLGEKVIDLGQAYANGNIVQSFSLGNGGSLTIKAHGGGATLFQLNDAGLTPETQVVFPQSTNMFSHISAAASDRTNNPHSLKLQARLFTISQGCLVGSVNSDQSVTLSTVATVGTLYSALGLAGAVPSNGSSNEGVLVGTSLYSQVAPLNIVLVFDASTNAQIFSGGLPVFGLLVNTGTQISPTWQLHFATTAGDYTFASGSPKTLKLYAQYAYSLSTVLTVDPRVYLVGQLGLTGV
jgi:hypothetical protein